MAALDGAEDELTVAAPTAVDAVDALVGLKQMPLGYRDDWWEPLSIDLALRWLEFEHSRRLLQRFSEIGVDDVHVATSRPRLWRALQGAFHVRLRVSTVAATRATTLVMSGPGRGDLAKFYGQDARIRRLVSLAKHQRSGGPTSTDLLGLLEVPTPSMSENVLRIAESAPMAILSCDPRTFGMAQHRGVPVVNLWERRGRRPLPELGAAVRTLLDSFDPRFASAVGNSIPRLATSLSGDYPLVESWLGRLRPGTVVMASDQHRYGVLTSWAAARLGIETVVVQHGFADHPLGYLPVRADLVAAIGEDSREWFIRNGTPPRSVAATGSPRFPEHRPFKTEPGMGAVLMPLNSNAPDVTREMLRMAGRLASQGVSTSVRPHPGDSYLRGSSIGDLFARYSLPTPGSRVAIDSATDVCRSLEQVELAIVWNSSVLYEALSLGVPVLLYDHRNGNPFARTCLTRTDSDSEVVDILEGGEAWKLATEKSIEARSRLVSAGGESAVRNILAAAQAR